ERRRATAPHPAADFLRAQPDRGRNRPGNGSRGQEDEGQAGAGPAPCRRARTPDDEGRTLMQPDRFTVKSQEAVTDALQLAARMRNPEAAPPHLLIALLGQDDGLAVPILQKAGSDPGSVRSGAQRAVEALPKLSGEAQPGARPSSALMKAVQRAEKEMGQRGDE